MNSVKLESKRRSVRTLRLRPGLPTCIHRKVSDERPRRTLEMGDFPLHILESRRKERLAELKAECQELKSQLEGGASVSIESGLDSESKLRNDGGQNGNGLSDQHSKSMHNLSRPSPRSSEDSGSGGAALEIPHKSLNRAREERLQTIRKELEEFAIRHSIGEYAEQFSGIDSASKPKLKPILRKSESSADLKVSSGGYQHHPGGISKESLQSMDPAEAAILLRIQRRREEELERARMELKLLAFRLKHKLDEERGVIRSKNTF